MTTVSVTEANARGLSALLRDSIEGDVIVERHGRPVGAVISTDRHAQLSGGTAGRMQIPVPAFDALSEAAEKAGDHRRYELIQGDLSVSPSPNRHHQRAVGCLSDALQQVVRSYGWRAQPGSDLRGPESVVCPDAMLVPDDGSDTPPTLVIEVTSTNRATDLGPKRHAYAATGISMYWVLDRERRALLVFTLDEQTSTYPEAQVFDEHVVAVVSVPVGEQLVEVSVDVADVLG